MELKEFNVFKKTELPENTFRERYQANCGIGSVPWYDRELIWFKENVEKNYSIQKKWWVFVPIDKEKEKYICFISEPPIAVLDDYISKIEETTRLASRLIKNLSTFEPKDYLAK